MLSPLSFISFTDYNENIETIMEIYSMYQHQVQFYYEILCYVKV